ncbi:MAG: hypothetical protein ACXU8O_00985 [Asticcacaulis sp.]
MAGSLIFAGLIMAVPAYAEEGVADTPAPAPAHPRTVKKKPPVTPPTSVPYTTLGPDAAKALTPASSPAPTDALLPPPPPPPVVMAAPSDAGPKPQTTAPAEISLRCNTVTSNGRKTLTGGTFYIDLFPSPVFPDQEADFKFLLVDPAHASLIRDSACMDMRCEANVSGSAYYLVNRVTKKGAALRITLNRADGAFYAEEITPGGLTQTGGHTGESGWCKPQPLPQAMF